MDMSAAQEERALAAAPAPIQRAALQRLRIEAISDPIALSRLGPEWEAIYRADPEAHVFLSWRWMRDHMAQRGKEWIVLAARTASEPSRHVGLMPLRFETDGAGRSLVTAGTPIADYTGFICLPEYEGLAVPGFAELLKRLPAGHGWSVLRLANLRASNARQRLFLTRFAGEAFRLKSERCLHGDGIDNDICPRIELPASWDAYLGTRVSTNMRQKLRRLERQMARSPEFVVRHATAATIQADLGAILRHWGEQWAERKGDNIEHMKKQSFAMLMRSFRAGSLFVPVLLRDGAVVAGLTIFVDEVKGAYLFYLAGRDKTLATPPPGLVLHAHSIRHAISRGFTTYDFLRGNEPYKFSFGAGEHLIRTLVVERTQAADTTPA